MTDKTELRATPEKEDFLHKYTEEGQGRIGGILIDGYFKGVKELLGYTGLGGNSLNNIKALEIGCGGGFSTQRIARLLPKNIELQASEYVAEQIPIAKELNPNVSIIEESIYELRRKDKEFDLVFLLEVLEHLDYPEKGLEEIHRVLKKDGYLIIGVPREPIWRILNMMRGKFIKGFGNTPGHINHWSTRSFTKFLSNKFGLVEKIKTPLPWTILLVRKRD